MGRRDRDPGRPLGRRRQHPARRRRASRHVAVPGRPEPEPRSLRPADRRRRVRRASPTPTASRSTTRTICGTRRWASRRSARASVQPWASRLAPASGRWTARSRSSRARAASGSARSPSGRGPTSSADLGGRPESWEVFTSLPEVQLDSGEHLAFNWLPAYERLEEPFEIQPGVVIPPGSYRWSRYQVEASSADKRPWVVEAGLWWGGFYAGRCGRSRRS